MTSPTRLMELGTHSWAVATGGQLTAAERRTLLARLAGDQAAYAAGRLSLRLRVNSGRRTSVVASRLAPPSSMLTRAAREVADERLTPALLNHSYRAFAYGAALGEVEQLTVDREVLLAAALLHKTGLPTAVRDIDFTVTSARIARDVAEAVGLSSAATLTLRNAITLHISPGVTSANGPVAYLLSAGVAMDATAFRSWKLPPDLIPSVVAQYPRLGFERELRDALLIEAVRMPQGRVRLLSRYGLDRAIKRAPFRS